MDSGNENGFLHGILTCWNSELGEQQFSIQFDASGYANTWIAVQAYWHKLQYEWDCSWARIWEPKQFTHS